MSIVYIQRDSPSTLTPRFLLCNRHQSIRNVIFGIFEYTVPLEDLQHILKVTLKINHPVCTYILYDHLYSIYNIIMFGCIVVLPIERSVYIYIYLYAYCTARVYTIFLHPSYITAIKRIYTYTRECV